MLKNQKLLIRFLVFTMAVQFFLSPILVVAQNSEIVLVEEENVAVQTENQASIQPVEISPVETQPEVKRIEMNLSDKKSTPTVKEVQPVLEPVYKTYSSLMRAINNFKTSSYNQDLHK